MSAFLMIADLVLALALFWHSANSPARDPVLRTMLYAFAFAVMCFGSARFMILFGASESDWQWMIDLGHASLIVFGIIWVARETGRMAQLQGKTR